MEHKTKLQAWMAEKGYSNVELARHMGFSYEYIYKFANGIVKADDRPRFKLRFIEYFGLAEASRVFDSVPEMPIAEVAI